MIKILFIHHSAAWGGAPGCLLNMIKRLDRSKYRAKVLLLKNSIVAHKLEENGIEYQISQSTFYNKYYQFFAHSEAGYLKCSQIYSLIKLSIIWMLSRYFFAKKELEKQDYDIVHLNSSVLTDWLAPAKRKAKVIIHIREPVRKGKLDLLYYFFRSTIKKYADQIIAISNDNAMRVNIPEKTQVIYDFYDIPKDLPEESSYESQKVLYLGGSSTSKGFLVLVEALDYLNKDVKVYFGGLYIKTAKPTNYLYLLKYYLSNAAKRNKAISKIENSSNAVMIGLVYDVAPYLREVSCLASPFTVPHFSFPIVEAFMHCKSVIATNVEGMDEIVENGKNGLLVPCNNAKALAEGINNVTSDSKIAKLFGVNGHYVAKLKFSPKNVKIFQNIYDRLYSLSET